MKSRWGETQRTENTGHPFFRRGGGGGVVRSSEVWSDHSAVWSGRSRSVKLQVRTELRGKDRLELNMDAKRRSNRGQIVDEKRRRKEGHG